MPVRVAVPADARERRPPCWSAHPHAGRLAEARAVWRPDVAPPRSYYWLLWTVLRAEVAVALDDRAVLPRSSAVGGHLAGLASGTVTLGPVAHVLADLAAAPPGHVDSAADGLGSLAVLREVTIGSRSPDRATGHYESKVVFAAPG